MDAAHRFSFFLCLLLLALPVSAGSGGWTPLGPDGGQVWALAVDPAHPDVVYAGGSSVFKSTDGGETWTVSSNGLPMEGTSVSAILVRPGAVFLGTSDGILYRSADGGASWVRSSNAISPIGSLASDPRRPARIWAGARKGLFSSTDNGAHWTTRYQGPPFDNRVSAVAIDPKNGQIYISSEFRGVYTSTNDGRKWTKVSFGLQGFYYYDLVLDPQNPSILHVATADGIWRSDNRGGRWRQVPGVSGAMIALVYQGTRLYAAGPDAGIFHSDDQGRTWTAAHESLADRGIFELAAGPATLHAGGVAGAAPLYLSRDRGETWEPSFDGIDSLPILALAVSPADADDLYAFAEMAGMYKSTDRGASWQLLGLDLGPPYLGVVIRTILVDRTNPSVVYGAIGNARGALVRSTDAGATWEPAPEDLQLGVEDLENGPGAAGTVWAAGNAAVTGGTALYRSLDYGAEWAPVSFPGGDLAWIRAFEVDPANPQVLWAAGGLFEVRPQGVRLHPRIHRSTDGGLTWQRRDSGIDVPDGATVVDLAIDPADPNRLYAATEAGLYRTADAGLTWTRVAALLGTVAFEVETAPTSPTTVWAWLPGLGVQRSTDGGATWTAVSAGLGAIPLNDLIVDPTNPRRLYGGTATRSLFTYEEP